MTENGKNAISRGALKITSTNLKETFVPVKIAILHIFPQLKQFNNNINLITNMVYTALSSGAKIVVAPELATTGYSITQNEVLEGLGLWEPFNELSNLKFLAATYKAYIILGIAEISTNNTLYNSAIIFEPNGTYKIQRKRGIAFWNSRGNDQFSVVKTPYGKIGVVICSGTYLMDWPRILALSGADIVITPTNWWGDNNQLSIWVTRAHENGVFMIVANRWGSEIDRRFNPLYTYNMNDAPSAIISPEEKILLSYRSISESNPENKILYYTLQIPKSRIETGHNPTWSINYRKVQAYNDLTLPYYRPDLGNKLPPDLPETGTTEIGVSAYKPTLNAAQNLARFMSFYKSTQIKPEVILLPAFGIEKNVDTTDPYWWNKNPWIDLQQFVDDKVPST